MPINASPMYYAAEARHALAKTNEEKLKALQDMLREAPKHKSSEVLLADIKKKISKIKKLMEKEKATKKGKGYQVSIKKEGAAQIVLVGITKTGKSIFLNKMTNSKVAVAQYPFTTRKPEIGIMDYKGVKLQIVEIPSIVSNFFQTELGPTLLGIIRQADLMILFFNMPEEKQMLDKELADIDIPFLIFNNQENIADLIWQKLNLVKIYTKQPGKKPDYPPIAMARGATVRDVAEHIHRDFVKKAKKRGVEGTWARLFGKSARFPGQKVGLDHILEDDDIIELHVAK